MASDVRFDNVRGTEANRVAPSDTTPCRGARSDIAVLDHTQRFLDSNRPVAKRRIALVLPVYWPAIGGCELHTRELALRLAASHDVRVITLVNSEEDKLAHELWLGAILRAPRENTHMNDGAVRVTRLGMHWARKILYAPLARIQSPKVPERVVDTAMELLARHYRLRLEPLLREVDIVHCVHGGVSFLGYAALQAARSLQLPFVYTPLMHWQQAVPARGGRCAAPDSLSLRLIPRSWTDHYWVRIWRQADAVLTMTDNERAHYVDAGVPAAKVFRTGVGPLLPAAASREPRRPAPEGDPMVLFLARNTLAKGVADVVHAAPLVWQEMPKVRFVIAGPRTPETDRLLEQVNDARMEVLGEVSEEHKDRLLNSCSVYCMPSREESLGATYLEAWSYGKPIVGLRIPPLEELTRDGRGGLLVAPDPADVAAKLKSLLGNPSLMREMGEWGRRQVRESYSWEAIVARTEAIYESLLDGSRRTPQPMALAAVS